MIDNHYNFDESHVNKTL